MTWLAVQLFLKGTFGKAWGWLTASSAHILIACLGASIAWGYVGWHGKATLARALHSTKAAYAMAQADAMRAQIEATKAVEAGYRSKADDSDKTYRVAIDDAQRRSERFIANGGVRRPVACSTSPAPAAAESGSPQGADRPGTSPELVTVTPADVNICTENTTRLQAARDWAIDLSHGN